MSEGGAKRSEGEQKRNYKNPYEVFCEVYGGGREINA